MRLVFSNPAIVINGVEQVSMGVLPAGQPTSMHAI